MIATRLTSAGAPIRLKVVDKGNALDAVKAFSSGETDLAVARADIGDLSAAEIVIVITRAVVLIVAPPGSSLAEMDDLKGKTVGVIGGEVNRQVVEALTQQYDLGTARTQFKDLAVADIPQAIKVKQVSALLVVMPLTEKYLTMLRNALPKSGKSKATLIPIEAAGAIAAVRRYYQSYALPKGTVSGSPPIPDDDMKTLHVPFYLVANKKLSKDVVAALANAVMDARRDLIGAFPLVAQISEPNTDKTDTDNDTYLPMHPGATAYFGGDQQTFFDKYGDQIFYGSLFSRHFDVAVRRRLEVHDEGQRQFAKPAADAAFRVERPGPQCRRRSRIDGDGAADRRHSQGRTEKVYRRKRRADGSRRPGIGDPTPAAFDCAASRHP